MAEWSRHKYFFRTFSSTKVMANGYPEDGSGHCLIHFDSLGVLQRWTAIMEVQQLIGTTNPSRILTNTLEHIVNWINSPVRAAVENWDRARWSRGYLVS